MENSSPFSDNSRKRQLESPIVAKPYANATALFNSEYNRLRLEILLFCFEPLMLFVPARVCPLTTWLKTGTGFWEKGGAWQKKGGAWRLKPATKFSKPGASLYILPKNRKNRHFRHSLHPA